MLAPVTCDKDVRTGGASPRCASVVTSLHAGAFPNHSSAEGASSAGNVSIMSIASAEGASSAIDVSIVSIAEGANLAGVHRRGGSTCHGSSLREFRRELCPIMSVRSPGPSSTRLGMPSECTDAGASEMQT